MEKDMLLKLLKKHLTEIIPELEEETILVDEPLRDLGANSVDRGELIALTLEQLELDIARVELVGAQTLDELADVLLEKMG
ncbi:MAG: acyl carrier protein [Bacteroidota bacterium]